MYEYLIISPFKKLLSNCPVQHKNIENNSGFASLFKNTNT